MQAEPFQRCTELGRRDDVRVEQFDRVEARFRGCLESGDQGPVREQEGDVGGAADGRRIRSQGDDLLACTALQ